MASGKPDGMNSRYESFRAPNESRFLFTDADVEEGKDVIQLLFCSELHGCFYGVEKIQEACCVLPLYNAGAVVYVTDENIWCGRKVSEGPLFNDLRSQIAGSHWMQDTMAITSIC